VDCSLHDSGIGWLGLEAKNTASRPRIDYFPFRFFVAVYKVLVDQSAIS
jgi:hypothetical protein